MEKATKKKKEKMGWSAIAERMCKREAAQNNHGDGVSTV